MRIQGRVTLGNEYPNPVIGFNIRLDYYKEIGAPKINSYDDAANALIAIHDKHPETDGGLPTYAFSLWQDWGLWHYTVLGEMMRSIGGVAADVVYCDYTDYTFVDGLADARSPVWTDSRLYNILYRAGLIDPNSFTQDNAQATTAMNNGQVLCQAASWLCDAPNADLAQKYPDNPDAGFVSIVLENSRYYAANDNPTGLACYYCISSKCSAPARAMDLINYMFSEEGSRTLLTGVKGDIWDYDASGKAVLTEKGYTIKSQPNFMDTTGIRKFQNIPGFDTDCQDSKGQYFDLFYEPDNMVKTLTALQKNWLNLYGVSAPDELWRKNNYLSRNSQFPAALALVTPPDEIKLLSSKITDYWTTAFP